MKRETITILYGTFVFLMVLVLCIAYAQVVTELKIEGNTVGQEQDGVYITEVEYLTNNGADTTNSKVNYFLGTMLDSKIVLGSSSSSTIAYKVTIKNNTDREQVFIGIIKDETNEEAYNNTSIQPNVETAGGITGIEEYVTTIAPGEYITFPVTYAYAGTDTSNPELQGKINFRFREKPILELSNNGETYTLENIGAGTEEEYEFTVSNYNETYTNGVPMTYTFETTLTEGSPLTVIIYDSEGNEVTQNITMPGDSTNADHTYTLKLTWDSSKNGSEYQAKKYECNVKLIATPDDTKYLDYTIKKDFDIDITTECKSYVVEYIESTGTQYIDTGIYPTDTTMVRLRFNMTEVTGAIICGYFVSESDSFRFFNSQGRAYLDYGSGSGLNRIYGGTITAGITYNIEFGNRYVKNLDSGENIISGTTVTFTKKTKAIGIFSDGNVEFSKGKLYYCQIFDNGVLVRDFIPALDENGVACLYDKVTKQYFYNSGTGTFNYSGQEIDHAFGDWEITKPATCVSTGTLTRTCSQCGKVETQIIEKTALTVEVSNITATGATITARDSGNNGDTLQYTLEINNQTYGPSTTNTWNVTGLSEQTTYSYTVTVTDGNETITQTGTLTTLSANTAPVIIANSLSSKTTTGINIAAKATDGEGDNLTYELWISTSQNGTYTKKATSASTAQNTQVTLTASSLSNYTTYWWYIVVNDGKLTTTSTKQSTKTYCPGGNTCKLATYCLDGGNTRTCRSCYGSGMGTCGDYSWEGDMLSGEDCSSCTCHNNVEVYVLICEGCGDAQKLVCEHCKNSGAWWTHNSGVCENCEGSGYEWVFTGSCPTHPSCYQGHYWCSTHSCETSGTSHIVPCSHGYTSQHDN